MFFNPKNWCMNTTEDMMFNIKTYKTIRKRVWHDNTKPDNKNDFFYFSFHELNASQAVAFLFASNEDAKMVHQQSANTKHNFDMVDFEMWAELNRCFLNGLPNENDFAYSENEE